MTTTLSIRLLPDLNEQLRLAAAADGITKSEYVRRTLEKQLAEQPLDRAELAWEMGKDLFGKYSSGRSDLSERCEEVVREDFDAKRRNR
mgnify:CR=1 FL=1